MLIRISKVVFSEAQTKSIALIKFLSSVAKKLGVAEHTYVVGGAVRNFLLDLPIKDVDVVIDSVKAKMDSAQFAKGLAENIPAQTTLATNQYGVAILTVKEDWMLEGENLKGEVIEIANARKESYDKGKGEGKGYKPTEVSPATIEEDVSRREFTFNTLMWRLLDLAEGPDKAEVIDLLGGKGLADLKQKMIKTPLDPDQTFSDDPTRMLRAIKFFAKYHMIISPEVVRSIKKNRWSLMDMPWEAVGNLLVEIFQTGKAREAFKTMLDLGLIEVVIKMMEGNESFTVYMARQLNDLDPNLTIDFMRQGIVIPGTIFSRFHFTADQYHKLIQLAEELGNKFRDFLKKLIHPPITVTEDFFKRFNIPLKERRVVVNTARQILLDDPEIDEQALQKELEYQLENING